MIRAKMQHYYTRMKNIDENAFRNLKAMHNNGLISDCCASQISLCELQANCAMFAVPKIIYAS
jgi:hypothetical protein